MPKIESSPTPNRNQTPSVTPRSSTTPPSSPPAERAPPPPAPSGSTSGSTGASQFQSTPSTPSGAPELAPSRSPAENLQRVDSSQLFQSRSGPEKSDAPPPPQGGPPPPPPLKTGGASRPPAGPPSTATSAPVSLAELEKKPDSKHVRITHEQFLDLSRPPPRSAQTEALQKRIHAASFPEAPKPGGFYTKPDKDPLKLRLDITGVPGAKGGTEQLSIAFTKPLGSPSVQMRAYQGDQLSTDDNKAILHVTFNKPEGETKTSSLEWIGTRPGQTPPNLSGGDLMKTFQGLLHNSGSKCSLKDASGKVIDPKNKEAGEVKLRLTGAYEQAKTWYMAQGAVPKDAPAWTKAAQQLMSLKVSDVTQQLGPQSTSGSGSSGMSLQQLTDAAAPHIAAASQGKYANAQAVKEQMPLGEFYREMSKPALLDKLAETAKGSHTSPAHMAHDFYLLAMERQVPNDPRPDLKAAVGTILDTSTFDYHFPTDH